MKKLIHHLRQKPAHVRRMVAFCTSLAITGFIGLVWVSSVFSGGLNPAPVAENVDKGPSPIAVLADQFSEMFKFAGNQLASVSGSLGFLQSSTTDSEIKYASPSKTTVESYGAIGVSTVSNQ